MKKFEIINGTWIRQVFHSAYDRAFNFVLRTSDISIIRSGRRKEERAIWDREGNRDDTEIYFKNYFIELTCNRSGYFDSDNSLWNSGHSKDVLMRFDYEDKDEEQFYEDLKTLEDLLFNQG